MCSPSIHSVTEHVAHVAPLPSCLPSASAFSLKPHTCSLGAPEPGEPRLHGTHGRLPQCAPRLCASIPKTETIHKTHPFLAQRNSSSMGEGGDGPAAWGEAGPRSPTNQSSNSHLAFNLTPPPVLGWERELSRPGGPTGSGSARSSGLVSRALPWGLQSSLARAAALFRV